MVTSDIIGEELVYELYYKIQKIKEINFIRKTIDFSEELKYLLTIEKNEFARMMVEENYYNKIFSRILKRNNIEFDNEERFLDLCKKVSPIKKDYCDKIVRIILEKNDLEKIKLLLDYSEDFSNRKEIDLDKKHFEYLLEEWLFENAYSDLKNCFINKFLKILNKESDEENIDKLFNELCLEVCTKRSDIFKECNEIKNRMNNTFKTNDERNVENINRLIELYEMI